MQGQSLRVMITGSNKGIGYGIIETALRHSQEQGGPQYDLIMTTRDAKSGQEAITKLQEQFPQAANIEVIDLDISKPESIAQAVESLKKSGPLDALINNAGWAAKGADPTTDEVVRTTIGINYFGTRNFTEAVLAAGLIRENARIINVSSKAAIFKYNSKLEQSELEKLNNYKSTLSFEEFTSLSQSIYERLQVAAKDETN